MTIPSSTSFSCRRTSTAHFINFRSRPSAHPGTGPRNEFYELTRRIVNAQVTPKCDTNHRCEIYLDHWGGAKSHTKRLLLCSLQFHSAIEVKRLTKPVRPPERDAPTRSITACGAKIPDPLDAAEPQTSLPPQPESFPNRCRAKSQPDPHHALSAKRSVPCPTTEARLPHPKLPPNRPRIAPAPSSCPSCPASSHPAQSSGPPPPRRIRTYR